MREKKQLYLIIFLLFFLSVIPTAAEKEKISFDPLQAHQYIADLSSNEMQGRMSGQPGGRHAEEYIAEKFKKWGLKPGGTDGDYFQEFTLSHFHTNPGAFFEVITPSERRTLYYGDDWEIRRFSGSGHFVKEIVYAGYGVRMPELEIDDYKNLDVQGRIVLFAETIPQELTDRWGESPDLVERIKTAQSLGAAGVITFRTGSEMARYFDLWDREDIYKKDFLWLSISDHVVDLIFKETPTDLRAAERRYAENNGSPSFATQVRANLAVSTEFDSGRKARNILAVIPGRDRKLKDEYVVIGAHMDHLGRSPRGEVFNGANDNASGTGVAMEIARVLQSNGYRPRRTLVFGLWGGEEQGLLGSEFYGKHPLFPMERTIVNFNLDMVGHGKNSQVIVRGPNYDPELWERIKSELPKEMTDKLTILPGAPGGSDQTPFMEFGVPAFFVQSGGPHVHYHRPHDDSGLIDNEALLSTGTFVQAVALAAADMQAEHFLKNRRELTHLKFQTLVNYADTGTLDTILTSRSEESLPIVNVQLLCLPQRVSEEADPVLSAAEKLVELKKSIAMNKETVFFESTAALGALPHTRDDRNLTIVAGIKGLRIFATRPEWLDAMARLGAAFITLDNPDFLFGENEVTEEGKKLLASLKSSGLLLIVKNPHPSKLAGILREISKPVVILSDDIPDAECLRLIKEKCAVLGMTMREDQPEPQYAARIYQAVSEIGSECVMIAPEFSLLKPEAKPRMIHLMREILSSDLKGKDVLNLFSGGFIRALAEVRGEEKPLFYAPIPY